MRKNLKKILAGILILACCLSGCGVSGYDESNVLSREEALRELEAKLHNVTKVEKDLQPDIYYDDSANEAAALADISVYPLTVEGRGETNIEIAAATELSSKAPDDLINVVAEEFNRSGAELNGKSVSVSVRQITSGEVVTYMTVGDYRPEVYLPSVPFWGEMLKSSGFNVITLAEKTIGNTAGILMKREVYNDFINKYDAVTIKNVTEASLAGDVIFVTTNPHSSSTGLNWLGQALACFDPENPLSEQATQKLLEYQSKAPDAAYTTAVLQSKATNGLIDAMVMEAQAYANTPELKNYVFTPFGERHDHPVYTFDYVSQEQQDAAKLFVEYLLSDEVQKIATQKGFNQYDNYKYTGTSLSGADYLAAQKVWKVSKNGGDPVIAVFVADISGSMTIANANGKVPINELKKSLLATMQYIGSDNYVGLISYSTQVYVDLPIEKFDEKQQACFSGAVKNLSAAGGTATYDAVLIALDMLEKKAEKVPNAKLLMFVLSDGDQRDGYKLQKVTDIVRGLEVPIYTIGYNLDITGERAVEELTELSGINEAAMINADPENIVNQLRSLFNSEL